MKGEHEVELRAVAALATFQSGKEEEGVKLAEDLVEGEESKTNASVQVLVGTVLQAGGKSEEALALLSGHQGNCKSSHSQSSRILVFWVIRSQR